jgi:hypothetical protein
MSKKYKAKNSKFRNIVFGVATVAISCVIGMSACTTDDDESSDSDKVSTKQDSQILQNGNFEFFDDNDGLYYISSPDSWTGSSSGTSSDSMSGIIKTDKTSWDAFTDPDLPQTLEDNDDLDDDDDDKVDYNGVLTDDLPYKDTHAATADSPDEDDLLYIDNPYTHLYKWDDDGNLINNAGETVTTYTNSSDDTDTTIYLDEACTQALETSVLMIHNYIDDNNNGTEYYYTSSTTLTLEANTAAKISVWVKTSELYFAGSSGDRVQVADSMGAYIKVDQTVGGTSLDSFYIKNINTEGVTDNNGWVQYNVYIQACDYAETTLTLTLGLGENSKYTVEGYAFFDDVEYTKYNNIDELKEDNGGETAFDTLIGDTTCDIMSTADEKKFRTDTVTIKTNDENGVLTDKVYNYYSDVFDYYINLSIADSENSNAFTFNSGNTSMGLTVDSDKYTSSKNTPAVSGADTTSGAGNAYIPKELSGGIDTSDDVLATLSISANWTNTVGGNYKATIENALKNAYNLPGALDTTSTFVMLSSEGAAYETKISDSTLFKVAPQSYKVVSFWVKTSDLKGNTAATITVKDVNDNTNSASFTVDSTTVDETEINGVENVYDGWVQCFVLVSNTLEESDSTDNTKQFEICVNFGNTTIKDTEATAYYNGWAAVTNMFVIDVDETAFGYISSDRSASIDFADSTSVTSSYFDTEFGSGKDIEEKIVRPANYNGVNGASASVTKTETLEITSYDDLNENAYAGLINKDYILSYTNLFSAITALKNLQDQTDKDAAWNAIADTFTVQPLLIVNTIREVAENKSGIYNYGYIASSSSTVSADSYEVVSVRVKVSDNAVAKVYLVDADTKDVLSFSLPAYTFWYDDEGNVLKSEPAENATSAEQKANIAYTLRSDGLYERDGKLYANIYNLKHQYFDEHIQYYDADGNEVSYESLDSSKLYYDSTGTKYAKHYLITDDSDRVYYYNQGTGADAEYYYVVDGSVDTSLSVKGFDTTLATLRYDNTDEAANSSPYVFTIDTTDAGDHSLANKWITVNFYIHTGNQEKSYRLELWSGSRDTEQTDGVEDGSFVMFDYSYTTIDEDGYDELRSYYEQAIIDDYRAKLTDTEFNSNDENISYYEALSNEKSSVYNYDARYYKFTLYDTSSYYPFNETTADEDETGYAYSYSEYDEMLTYLYVEDTASSSSASMSMFIDYSTSEKDISVGRASDVEEDEDETETDTTSVWLLISSICLVVALIVAILAVLIKDLLKNRKRRKSTVKNTYNYNKNKRFVKKMIKANGEAPAVTETSDSANNSASDNANEVTTESEQTESEQPSTPSEESTEAENVEANETEADNAETSEPEAESKDANSDEKPEE